MLRCWDILTFNDRSYVRYSYKGSTKTRVDPGCINKNSNIIVDGIKFSICGAMANMDSIPGELDLYLDSESIAYTVSQIANKVDIHSEGVSLTVVGILKGSFIFLADLLRQMQTPVDNVEFLRVSSYGPNMVSSGDPYRLDELPDIVVEGRHVLVIEDVIDTGLTTENVCQYLLGKKPASLRLCCLLNKPERRQVNVHVDYIGVTVPDLFLVGYGLDVDERFRQLASIYSLSR